MKEENLGMRMKVSQQGMPKVKYRILFKMTSQYNKPSPIADLSNAKSIRTIICKKFENTRPVKDALIRGSLFGANILYNT
jgi:hypothetical protein